MLNFLLAYGAGGVFSNSPNSASHANEVLIVYNCKGEIFLVKTPLAITVDFSHGLTVIGQTLLELFKNLLFSHGTLDEVSVAGNIVALLQTVDTDTVFALSDLVPGSLNNIDAAAGQAWSQGSHEVSDAKRIATEGLEEGLQLDLAGEDVEVGQHSLELPAADVVAAGVESQTDSSEGDSLLLLDLHSEVVDNAIGLNV